MFLHAAVGLSLPESVSECRNLMYDLAEEVLLGVD